MQLTREFIALMHKIEVNPTLLIEYLKEKTAEDREILRIHPSVYRDSGMIARDQLITNAEMLVARTYCRKDRKI